MADIFEEVDEDLKQENYRKLWDRYGRYAIAVLVLIVAGTAANVGWKEYVENRQLEYSERFLAAVEQAQAGDAGQAAGTLAQLAADANAGYALLARFREAGLRKDTGEAAAAIDIYDTIAEDDAAEPVYRGLATLLSVMLQVETGDPTVLSGRLKPLVEDGPWRHSANEYLGVLALRQGDMDAARGYFAAVADDAVAPDVARQRAAEVLQTLSP